MKYCQVTSPPLATVSFSVHIDGKEYCHGGVAVKNRRAIDLQGSYVWSLGCGRNSSVKDTEVGEDVDREEMGSRDYIQERNIHAGTNAIYIHVCIHVVHDKMIGEGR